MLLRLTDKGLYCEAGDFYVDPNRAVERALITHGHSDHARSGSQQYWTHRLGAGLVQHRLGAKAKILPVEYGETLEFGSTKVSFHPAGHILGSAQIRIESASGEVWVVTGDYKRDDDPTCAAFEPVRCDVLVTEATFGSPLYHWPEMSNVAREIYGWWEENRARGRTSVILAYSLGKTQRVLAELARLPELQGDRARTVYLHPTAMELTEVYRQNGVKLLPFEALEFGDKQEGFWKKQNYDGDLVIAPPSASEAWMGRVSEPALAFASGWMQVRKARRGRGYDRSFVMSDHADWNGLVRTIRESGARQVLVMHEGSRGTLGRYLKETLGVEAQTFEKTTVLKAPNTGPLKTPEGQRVPASASHQLSAVTRDALTDFAELVDRLEHTLDFGVRRDALSRAFEAWAPADTARALRFLQSPPSQRWTSAKDLRTYLEAVSPLPAWLLEESIEACGDRIEAANLLFEQALNSGLPAFPRKTQYSSSQTSPARFARVKEDPSYQLSFDLTAQSESRTPSPSASNLASLHDWGLWLDSLAAMGASTRDSAIAAALPLLSPHSRHLLMRFLSGTFRTPVPQTCIDQALSYANKSSTQIERRHSVQAVLLYAQPGREYSFAVWNGEALLSVLKATPGALDREDLRDLNEWIYENSIETFGPVHTVKAERVFEIAFEEALPSARHRSGLNIIGAQMVSWKKGLAPTGADSLAKLQALVSTAE